MKKLNEEHLDKIMAMVAKASAADETAVNEIADSPQLWWSVQRNIAQQSSVRSPWPPANVFFRWFAIGVPSLAVLVLTIFYFAGRTFDTNDITQTTAPAFNSTETIPANEQKIESSADEPVSVVSQPSSKRATKESVKPVAARSKGARPVRPERREEIRSEFIALSYAGNPESGHLVRVKVPSSMMVNLGLVDSVEKPSSLVDAEVVVGDDGQTHAIRFIRQ